MGCDTSEQVMTLLKELAVLKERTRDDEANPTEGEHESNRLRQQRQAEITQEIKNLAEENTSPNDSESPTGSKVL